MDQPRMNSSDRERRIGARFPLELSGELSAGDVRIRGRTANIGRGGLLMMCDGNVDIGTIVTVRLNWPVPQGDKRVILVLQGEIIRCESNRIAILHQEYDFEVC